MAEAGAGGTVDDESALFEHAFGAEEMVAVADEEAGAEVHAVHDFAGGEDALEGGFGFGFDEDGFAGDAFADEVVAADFAFGEVGVAAGATGGEDAGGETLAVEIEGVVESAFEDGGGAAAVFGGTEDEDDIGGMSFVEAGGEAHLDREVGEYAGDGGGDDSSYDDDPA